MDVYERSRRDQRGIVGVHLVLVIAFAFYAVTMLSRTTLAARSIDDNVRVIVTEIGPGSNVSRLDETQKLNSVAATAEEILAAARPLSGQAQEILTTVRSVDGTASAIVANVGEINPSVRSIDGTAAQLVPLVEAINGQGSSASDSSGVAGINMRADALRPEVTGISTDLAAVTRAVDGAGNTTDGVSADTIGSHVRSIDCALASPTSGLIGVAGGLLGGMLNPSPVAVRSCP